MCHPIYRIHVDTAWKSPALVISVPKGPFGIMSEKYSYRHTVTEHTIK